MTSLPLALAASLVAGGAIGANTAHASSVAPAEDDALAKAKELYKQGQAKYETLDYLGAIELWTEAYAEIPAGDEFEATRSVFLRNLGKARVNQYDMDKDEAHLLQARGLLQRYLDSLDRQAADPAELEAIESQLADVEARLAAAGDGAEGDGTEAGGAGDTEAGGETTEGPATGDGSGPGGGEVDDPGGSGKPLIITGAVVAGVGVGMLGVMAAGMANGASAKKEGEAADPTVPASELQALVDKGRTGNTLALVGGIGGGVLIAAGTVIAVLGVKKNKDSATAWRVRPTGSAGRGWAALGLRGEF